MGKNNELARFWQKVDRRDDTECWLWTGGMYHDGYGRFSPYHRENVRAHRYAYAVAFGEIPEGAVICHKCDTPACVNPSHLFAGSVRDNARDMRQKGRSATGERNGVYTQPDRHARGEQSHHAKLTAADVLAIRTASAQGTRPQAIAGMYGVSSGAIYHILNGKTWKHV